MAVNDSSAANFVEWGRDLFDKTFLYELVDNYPNLDPGIYDPRNEGLKKVYLALEDMLYDIVLFAQNEYLVKVVQTKTAQVLVSALKDEEATMQLDGMDYEDIAYNYQVIEEDVDTEVVDVEEA